MKILIAYASKTGTAAKCAAILAEKLPGAALCDLAKEKPDPTGYDMVIVGGSIRAGGLSPEAREYLDKCEKLLMDKELGLYICCGSDEQSDEAFARNVPEALISHAKCRMAFGGELDPARARGFEKFMIKMMLKSAEKDGVKMSIKPERIDEFAKRMLGA